MWLYRIIKHLDSFSLLESSSPIIFKLKFLAKISFTDSDTHIVVVKLLSHVQLFGTPCMVAYQTSPFFAVSNSLLRLTFIELVGHPTISFFPSCPQSFPASGSFPMSWLFTSGGQIIGASALTSASVLPMNIPGWFPLGLTDLISLLSKGLSTVFSSTTIEKHQFFSAQPVFMVQLVFLSLRKL